ncbi:hypothetical protein HanIR_Chr14g0696571 [Helianthus annuus]|nr:hypothetical protein HanIR_Chr14g0696571 [Helianthus annuus]
MLHKITVNFAIPSPGGLFQPIQRFVKLEHHSLLPFFLKSRRMCNIHLLVENSIQKRRLDIKLIRHPPFLSRESKNNSYCFESSNG